MAFTGGLAIKGLFDTNQRITDISRNLNVTRKEATALNQRMNKLGASNIFCSISWWRSIWKRCT